MKTQLSKLEDVDIRSIWDNETTEFTPWLAQPENIDNISEQIGIDLTVEEKNLTFDDLLSADEAFYSGTAVEITPITTVDGLIIGSGSIGPITDQLQTNYSDIVYGRDKSYSHWLTSI